MLTLWSMLRNMSSRRYFRRIKARLGFFSLYDKIIWGGNMVTTIHTKKDIFQDNQTYSLEKDQLFHRLTIKMILNELKNNDIFITQKEVKETYQKNYNLNQTIDIFDEKYTEQLDTLGLKNEMFDDDALAIVIMKIIEHDFDVHSLPDIVYIARDINELIHSEIEYPDLLKKTKSILKRLNKMKKYQDVQDLQNEFAPYGIDLEQFFTRVFQDIYYFENERLLKQIYDLFVEFQQQYQLSLRYVEIRINILATIILYDQNDIDEQIKDIISKYPDYTLTLYYQILNSLTKINQKQLKEHYLKEALQYSPQNEEQADLLDVIKEIFC